LINRPLNWWIQRGRSQCPILYKMALDYLTISSNSCECERCFSGGQRTITDDCNCLSRETMRHRNSRRTRYATTLLLAMSQISRASSIALTRRRRSNRMSRKNRCWILQRVLGRSTSRRQRDSNSNALRVVYPASIYYPYATRREFDRNGLFRLIKSVVIAYLERCYHPSNTPTTAQSLPPSSAYAISSTSSTRPSAPTRPTPDTPFPLHSAGSARNYSLASLLAMRSSALITP
jgi:hypothetical protein